MGLSAILSQCTSGTNNRKVVAYISRTLSEVERRYSQTEREALAIVWPISEIMLLKVKYLEFVLCCPVLYVVNFVQSNLCLLCYCLANHVNK